MARGGSSKGGQPPSREVLVSKKLSWLLRHGAEKEGLQLQKGGYVNLSDALKTNSLRGLRTSLDEIRTIVAENAKQRFSLIHDTTASAMSGPDSVSSEPPISSIPMSSDPADYLIRANQGHSLEVEDEGLLTPLTLADELPHIVVHGTRHDRWSAIAKSEGLRPMTRKHVHFATGVPASLQSEYCSGITKSEDANLQVVMLVEDKKDAPTVVSGMRVTSSILMYLDLPKALKAGIKFSISANGVVLSEGNQDGIVPLEVFDRVEEKGGHTLLQQGVVVAEPELEVQRAALGARGSRRRGNGLSRGRGRGQNVGQVVVGEKES